MKEIVEKKPGKICDAPATSIRAFTHLLPRDDGFILFVSGGCGTDREMRNGPTNTFLRDIVDSLCPNTYDSE